MKQTFKTIAVSIGSMGLLYAAFSLGLREGRRQGELMTARFAQQTMLILLDTCRPIEVVRASALERIVNVGSGRNLVGNELFVDMMNELDKLTPTDANKK